MDGTVPRQLQTAKMSNVIIGQIKAFLMRKYTQF
jgi:hypothetical protein